MNRIIICKFLFILTLALLLSETVFAQNTFELAGRVVDSNRDPISGARVTVKSPNTQFQRIMVTNESGEFAFLQLTGGQYQLTVEAEGFSTKNLTADLTQTFNVEIILSAGRVAEVVSVTSSYLAGSQEMLEQTSGSLQMLDKFQLEQSRVFNFSEALRKFSGVTVRDEEGFGLRPNIGIRGTNPTRSTKILLLEDGLPLAFAPYGDNASYYHPPVERFESIEVQKGSGQIAYGPVTVAGLVNYITPNPPDKPAFSLKLIGGNRNYFNGNAQFGGTFGRTGLILNFNRKQGLGARQNIRSGLNDFSSKIVQTLNDNNILTGKFSIFRENSQVTYSGLTEAEFQTDPRQNPFLNDRFTGRRTGISLQHVIVFNSKTNLTTNFYSNYFSRDWWRQSSNSAQRPNRLNIDADCRSMADLLTTCGNEGRLRDYQNWGIEPRLNIRFGFGKTENDLNMGFRYTRENQERLQLNGDLPTSRDGFAAENNLRKNEAVSGFVQNRFIFNGFALTAGVRLEKIAFRRLNRLTNSEGETSLTEIIPGIGIAYNAFRNTTFFAGLHRGFAPPRTEDIISNSGGVIDLSAERSWNFELGIRTRPMNGISLESTFFRTDFENQIVPASVAGGIGASFTNGGRTLHQGFEFSARLDSSALLKTRFNIYLTANYTNLFNAEFRGLRFSSIAGLANFNVRGNRLPYASQDTLNASFGYIYKNLDIFVETNYLSRQFTDDLNTVNPTANGQRGAIAAQTYFNTTANYRLEKFKSVLFLTVKNLFDRTFIVDRSRGILPSSPRLWQTGVKINL